MPSLFTLFLDFQKYLMLSYIAVDKVNNIIVIIIAFLGAWCPPPAFRSCKFVEFAQRSNDLLMNLWGRKWSPHPIPPAS